MFKNIYQKLILGLCIVPSSAALYAMDAKYQFEVKAAQADAKTRAQEPVAGLNEQDAQIQVKLAWDEQIKILVSAAALLQSAMLKAAYENDKDVTEIPVTYKKCTAEQFKSFCALLELAAQDKQQELRASLQQLAAADLLEIYHVSCYYDVKAVREEIIKALPVSLAELAKQDGIKAVQDLLAATEFLGAAAEKECKDVLIGQFPWIYAACGKLQKVGGIEGDSRTAWSSAGTLAVISRSSVLMYTNNSQMGSTYIVGGLQHPASVQEIAWHPNSQQLVTIARGSVYFWHHDGHAWRQQTVYTPQVDAGGSSSAALSVHWVDAQSLVFILDASQNNVQHWRLHENTLQHEHTSTVTKFWGGRNFVNFQWSSQGCLFVASLSTQRALGEALLPGIISYAYRDGQWQLLKNSLLDGAAFDFEGIVLDQATFGILSWKLIKDKIRLIIYKPNEQGWWTITPQALPDLLGGMGISDKLSPAWQPYSPHYSMALSSDGSTLAIHKRINYMTDSLLTQNAGLYPWKSFVYLLRKQENNAWRLVDTVEIVDHHTPGRPGPLREDSIAWSAQGDRLAVTSFHGDVHILGFGENVTNISVKDLLLSMVVEQLKDTPAGASALRRDKAILEEATKKSSTLRQALRIEPKWYTKEAINQRVQKIQRWVKRNPKTAIALCVAGGLLAYYAKKRLAPRVKKSIIMPLVARLKRKAIPSISSAV